MSAPEQPSRADTLKGALADIEMAGRGLGAVLVRVLADANGKAKLDMAGVHALAVVQAYVNGALVALMDVVIDDADGPAKVPPEKPSLLLLPQGAGQLVVPKKS